ncbi:MAG: hypothetical protein WC375_06160 [Methanomassiliicoccales archaeon]|jgi:hypothetical protein
MQITKSFLKSGLPPLREYTDGSINCVLAYRNFQEESAGMRQKKCLAELERLFKWEVSNVSYYCLHSNEFDGWIDIEADEGQMLSAAGVKKMMETSVEGGDIVFGKFCKNCKTGSSGFCTCDFVDPFSLKASMVNDKMPPIVQYDDGYYNSVVARHSDLIYASDGSNSYIPRWSVTSSLFYHYNPNMFSGWIGIAEEDRKEVSRRYSLTDDENHEHVECVEKLK